MDRQQQLQLAKEILAKNNVNTQPIQTGNNFAEKFNNAFKEEPTIKQPTVAGQVIRGAVKPLARLGNTLTAPVRGAVDKIAGFDSQGDIQSDYLGNVTGYGMKEGKTAGERAKDVAGGVLQTASYLFPYGTVAKGVGGALAKPLGTTAAKVAGNIISGATGGYVADVGMNLDGGEKSVAEALKPGVATAIGGVIPVVAPVLRATGRAASKLGGKAVEMAIPTSTREAQILQNYKANVPFFERVGNILSGTEKAPVTAGVTATTIKNGQTIPGLFGTKSQIGVQAKRAADSLWSDVISPALKKSNYAVDLDGFFSKVEKDIIENTPEVSRQKSLLEALQSYKEDYSGIHAVSLEKLQKLKEGWAEFVPEKAYQGKPIAGAINEVKDLLADEARQTIYTQLGDDVKKAYFDYGNLIGLKKMGQVAMTGSRLKGGSGSFITDIISRAVTPVATVGGQAVYRVGKGIEFIGELGAKNIGEALGIKGGLKFPGDSMLEKKSYEASNPIKEQTSQITKITPKTNKNVSISKLSNTPTKNTSTLSTLEQEAKKYKNAEDFVDEMTSKNFFEDSKGYTAYTTGQEKLNTKLMPNEYWHGTNKSFDEFYKNKNPVFLTKESSFANNYAKQKSKTGGDLLMKVSLPENIKILKSQDVKNYLRSNIPEGMYDNFHYAGARRQMNKEEIINEISENGINWQLLENTVNQKNGKKLSSYISNKFGAMEMLENGDKTVMVFNSYNAKPSKLTKSQLTDIWNKANSKQYMEDNLLQEAKKYKSAEEFIKAQGTPVFHGTDANFTEFDIKKSGSKGFENKFDNAIFVSPSKSFTKQYGKNTIEGVISPDAKILNYDDIKYDPRYDKFFEEYTMGNYRLDGKASTAKEAFARKYADVIKYGANEYVVVNPNVIKTKSQLTDIWNKANKK